jgi:hypothetical protein
MEQVPDEFVNTAMPNGVMAPNLAKRGGVGQRALSGVDPVHLFFQHGRPDGYGITRPSAFALRLVPSVWAWTSTAKFAWAGAAGWHCSALNPGVTSVATTRPIDQKTAYDLPRAKSFARTCNGYIDRDLRRLASSRNGQPLVPRNRQPARLNGGF